MAASELSPWRAVIEQVTERVAGRRDEIATIGSINWLRHAMELKGANPNVVRNIIYRDKGRLHDKRALFQVLQQLRAELDLEPISDPALTYLGSAYAEAELEVSQVLGREQRRAYRALVGGIRSGAYPRLLVLGKPGSGKTMLADYIQRALEQDEQAARVSRFDFSESDLNTSFVRFATELGSDPSLIESRLVRIGTTSAFAVQADAQVDVVRILVESLRREPQPRTILLHLGQGLNEPGRLGAAPLRLNTPEVPRVSAAEWLWSTLISQLAALPQTALFVSTTGLPGGVHGVTGAGGWFAGPLTLNAPTSAEAKRFVAAHAPQLDESVRQGIVERAGRSYEALRTLSVLALVRRHPGSAERGGEADDEALERLVGAIDPGSEPRLRGFLVALSTLCAVEPASLGSDELLALSGGKGRRLSSVEQAFLDRLPGKTDSYRPFSRRFVRRLAARLAETDPEAARSAHVAAAAGLQQAALAEPSGEEAMRYLKHSLAARDFAQLTDWLTTHPVPYAVLDKVWAAALEEREALTQRDAFDTLALELARQLVRLGAADHVEAVRAFELLAASEQPQVRAWTAVLRAQTELTGGRFERAQTLLDVAPPSTVPVLEAERALTEAGILRWRAEFSAAAARVAEAAEVLAEVLAAQQDSDAAGDQASTALTAKVAVWTGLIAKDRGDLPGAIQALWTSSLDDDLIEGRLAFLRGDVAVQLGLFDLAGRELDGAIAAASRSGALAEERSHYLARYGTLARLRGDLESARHLFEQAGTVLEQSDAGPLDLAFARARLGDEGALVALASGDFESAIVASTTAIATYRDYQRQRGVDADFRIARASLRLATAYAFRGMSLPFRRPWPLRHDLRLEARGDPDIAHAAASLTTFIEELAGNGNGPDQRSSRVRGLLREARLMLGYLTANRELALELVDSAAADARFDYQRAEAHAGRAAVLLALGDQEAALAAIDEAEAHRQASLSVVAQVVGSGAAPERGDLGLVAQLTTYKMAAELGLGVQTAAADTLSHALEDDDLAPFHEGILRAFGEIADAGGRDWRQHRRLRSVLGLNGTGPSTPARLPDALVALWRERAGVSRASELS